MSDLTVCNALVAPVTGTPHKGNEQCVPFEKFFNHDRIAYKKFSRYGYMPATKEDAISAREIIHKKARNARIAAKFLRDNGVDKLTQQLERDGIVFSGAGTALDYTYLLADDTAQAIPKAIWDIIRPLLAENDIIEESLKATDLTEDGAPYIIDGVHYVSITDIGPILSATGQQKFWEMVRLAAAQIEPYKSGAPVPVYHEVLCALVCAADSIDAPYKLLKGHKRFNLFTPNGLLGEVPVPAEDVIITTDHFLCSPDQPHKSVISGYDEYAENNSTRCDIYRQAAEYIHERNKKLEAKAAQNSGVRMKEQTSVVANDNLRSASNEIVSRLSRKASKNKARRALVAQISIGEPEEYNAPKLGEASVEKFNLLPNLMAPTRPDTSGEIDDDYLNAKSMRFKFKEESTATHPDVVVFAPFDPNDEKARLYNYMMLHAAVVAKGTDPACQDMKIIVINLKDKNGVGCYDAFEDSHISYANSGYNKEYVLPVSHGGNKVITDTTATIKHTTYYYIDMLSGSNIREMNGRAGKIIRKHQRYYRRMESEIMGTVQNGGELPTNLCHVTIFASAGSDKLSDYKKGDQLGGILAQHNVVVLTGGSDDHAMWFPVKSLLRNLAALGKKVSYLFGTSTHNLVRTETNHNGIAPEFTHSALFDLIGPRQHELMKGDIFVSVGGGNGTGFETNEVVFLKSINHPLMKDKEIFFIGEDPSMLKEIASQIGRKKFARLLDNPLALKDEGIYLFKTVEDAEPYLHQSIKRVELCKGLAASPAPVAAAALVA